MNGLFSLKITNLNYIQKSVFLSPYDAAITLPCTVTKLNYQNPFCLLASYLLLPWKHSNRIFICYILPFTLKVLSLILYTVIVSTGKWVMEIHQLWKVLTSLKNKTMNQGNEATNLEIFKNKSDRKSTRSSLWKMYNIVKTLKVPFVFYY